MEAIKFRPHSDYQTEVVADFTQIEPYLPSQASSILDIGCGLAGISALLKKKYPEAKLTLLDSDGDNALYSWEDNSYAYGSRDKAERLLEANGVSDYEWLPAGYKGKLKADLVVSLLAWGFHFPLRTYDVSGFCIADLRKHHEEARGKVISENSKVARCAFTC